MTNTSSLEFGKTLTSGITSLVKGKKDYYILEHLVGSQYHQAGENQEVMLDEIILGREEDCHVRFDESFSTVSRHHARIVKEGDNWRLIQESKTNTTFLNGKAVQDSWYLQSGDEIQLAVNGPKMIFKIPSETTEFKFTQRLSSFKEQVIRPYQTAFIAVCCVIVLIIAGGITAGVVIKKQSDNLKAAEVLIESLVKQTDEMTKRLDEEASKANEAERKAIAAQKEAFNARKKAIQSEKDMQKMQAQLEELNRDMDSFMEGLKKGINK